MEVDFNIVNLRTVIIVPTVSMVSAENVLPIGF